MGIIRALETWRHYLQGSPHLVTIFSDHKNLMYFCQTQKLNQRQARWSLFLSQFDVKLIHVPGSQMVQSDALLRREDFDTGDTDNEDMTMLPESLFINSIDVELHDLLAESITKDDLVIDALRAIKHGGHRQ
jgi:RNase H-like domain found in reverse transcriptase